MGVLILKPCDYNQFTELRLPGLKSKLISPKMMKSTLQERHLSWKPHELLRVMMYAVSMDSQPKL
jgi:hypothetical protein